MACSRSTYGCPHYKNYVKIRTPCCKKEYSCKVCHNEEENHIIYSALIQELICRSCNKQQDVAHNCKNCFVKFGQYSCLECKIFDEPKQQYHCKQCGICRIGPKHLYFHCTKCNLCLSNVLKNNHKCVENVTRDNCPVCMEDLHSSRICLKLLVCGHFLHEKCHNELVVTNKDSCPVCRAPLALKPLDRTSPVYPARMPFQVPTSSKK